MKYNTHIYSTSIKQLTRWLCWKCWNLPSQDCCFSRMFARLRSDHTSRTVLEAECLNKSCWCGAGGLDSTMWCVAAHGLTCIPSLRINPVVAYFVIPKQTNINSHHNSPCVDDSWDWYPIACLQAETRWQSGLRCSEPLQRYSDHIGLLAIQNIPCNYLDLQLNLEPDSWK